MKSESHKHQEAIAFKKMLFIEKGLLEVETTVIAIKTQRTS